jgi:hypothetical protein
LNTPDCSEVERQWREDELIADELIYKAEAEFPQVVQTPKRAASDSESQSAVGSPSSPTAVESPRETSDSPPDSPRSPPSSTGTVHVEPPAKKLHADGSSSLVGFKLMQKRRLQRAVASGDIKPSGVTKGQILQTPGLTKTVKDWEPAAHDHEPKTGSYTFGGLTYPLRPNLTARAAKLVRSGSQPGSGVGDTRPQHWWEFLALVGPQARKKWVQGHFINCRLGGLGKHENLAPFTYSMNSVHYYEVERYVLAYRPTGTVSYTVRSSKGRAGSVNEKNSIQWHRAFLVADRPAAIAAMVAWSLVNAADAPALIKQGPAHPHWQAITTAAVHKICTYVEQTFPVGITCRARYYDAGLAKRVGQVVIDNTP